VAAPSLGAGTFGSRPGPVSSASVLEKRRIRDTVQSEKKDGRLSVPGGRQEDRANRTLWFGRLGIALTVLGLFAALLWAGSQFGAPFGQGDSGDDSGGGLSPFFGVWDGQGGFVAGAPKRESWRTLNIGSLESAGEQINNGCCHVVVLMRFRISQSRGTAGAATARATVTRVEIVDRKWFTKAHPAPYVGEVGTIRMRNHVIYEGLTGASYCARGGTWRPQLCGSVAPRPVRAT
jgi:hypothetical protein